MWLQKNSWSIKQLISHRATEDNSVSGIEANDESFCEVSKSNSKRHSWLSQTSYNDVASTTRKGSSATSADRNSEGRQKFSSIESYLKSLSLCDRAPLQASETRTSPATISQSDLYFLALMPTTRKGSSKHVRSCSVTTSNECQIGEESISLTAEAVESSTTKPVSNSKQYQTVEPGEKISHQIESTKSNSNSEGSKTTDEAQLDLEHEETCKGVATTVERQRKLGSEWYDDKNPNKGKKEKNRAAAELKSVNQKLKREADLTPCATAGSDLQRKPSIDASQLSDKLSKRQNREISGSRRVQKVKPNNVERAGSCRKESFNSFKSGTPSRPVEPFYVECFSKRNKKTSKNEVKVSKKIYWRNGVKVSEVIVCPATGEVIDRITFPAPSSKSAKSSTSCNEKLPLPSIPEVLSDATKSYLESDGKTACSASNTYPPSPTLLHSPAWSLTAPQLLQGPIQIQSNSGIEDTLEYSSPIPIGESGEAHASEDTESKPDEVELESILSWWSSLGFLGYGALITEPLDEDPKLMARTEELQVHQDQLTRGEIDDLSFPLIAAFNMNNSGNPTIVDVGIYTAGESVPGSNLISG
ncbi:hypothetical protein K3495_g7582 [Podosphaera aphanis]|nr:hypothetical protein K3495_g7582 [Podosphaera aphanis]